MFFAISFNIDENIFVFVSLLNADINAGNFFKYCSIQFNVLSSLISLSNNKQLIHNCKGFEYFTINAFILSFCSGKKSKLLT